MSALFAGAVSAIRSTRAPAMPYVANPASAASRMRVRVASESLAMLRAYSGSNQLVAFFGDGCFTELNKPVSYLRRSRSHVPDIHDDRRPPPDGRPRGHPGLPAHDDPRRVDRDHGAHPHQARAGLQRLVVVVDPEQLRPRLRRPPAA